MRSTSKEEAKPEKLTMGLEKKGKLCFQVRNARAISDKKRATMG